MNFSIKIEYMVIFHRNFSRTGKNWTKTGKNLGNFRKLGKPLAALGILALSCQGLGILELSWQGLKSSGVPVLGRKINYSYKLQICFYDLQSHNVNCTLQKHLNVILLGMRFLLLEFQNILSSQNI